MEFLGTLEMVARGRDEKITGSIYTGYELIQWVIVSLGIDVVSQIGILYGRCLSITRVRCIYYLTC